MSRQIPSILPQPRGATVAPPARFNLAFAPADYNPYVFVARSKAKTTSWRTMLGTMAFFLEMEGDAPPTASEAWAALLADQHIADHPTELPPVEDRRLALEVISRRAHISRALWGGGKTVAGEALPAADATPARVVKSLKDCEKPDRYKLPDTPIMIPVPRKPAKPPKEQSVGEFVEAVRAENKAARTTEAIKTMDQTLEEIAAFKLKQEVEAETARRLSDAPKPEWEGF